MVVLDAGIEIGHNEHNSAGGKYVPFAYDGHLVTRRGKGPAELAVGCV